MPPTANHCLMKSLIRGVGVGFCLCALLRGGVAAPQQPSASPAFAPKYMEQIALRHVAADTLAKTLNAQKLPLGVQRVSVAPDDKATLRVFGTADGVAAMKAMIALMDVAPRKASFRVTIERAQFAATGVRYSTTLYSKTVTLATNVPHTIKTTDKRGGTFIGQVTARLPQVADAKPTVIAGLGYITAKGKTVSLERALPLPTKKQVTRLVGITFADESDFIGTVGVGNYPKQWKGEPVAYYLAVRPLSVISAPSKP